jgi:isopentenyl-diphosphate Delta-isomerase
LRKNLNFCFLLYNINYLRGFDMQENGAKISSRKVDHIRINLEEDVSSGITTGLEMYRFRHNALPELNFENIEMHLNLFKRKLNAPLLISSMTGGSEQIGNINKTLALAAQESGVALGVGSQRAALEYQELVPSFQIRKYAPDILLFANIGAVQLNYENAYEDYCNRAVEMVEADALFLHLNPLQEALQPEGNVNFKGLLTKIEKLAHTLPVPIVVKEVGWGISGEVARQLSDAGVAGIDVAGAGGTSWSQVEKYRINDIVLRHVAGLFRDWGIPTAEAVIKARQAMPQGKIFASGGIRNGLEIAKCIALGADLVGSAAPFLKSAMISVEETICTIVELTTALKITMFAVGAKNLDALRKTELEYVGRK